MSQIEMIVDMRKRLYAARARARELKFVEAVEILELGIRAGGKDREIRMGKLYADIVQLRNGIKSVHPDLFPANATG